MNKSYQIQSLHVGFSILRSMAERKNPMTLSELSKATALHKSQLYRYLNSFVELGVLNRLPGEPPRWVLGPELIGLGGAALECLDVARQAVADIAALRDAINETVALSVWRERGPFFVIWEKSNNLVNVGLGVGSYVPLYTATGKVFRAFMPEEVTDPLYQSEVVLGPIDTATYDGDIEHIRQTRLSVTNSSLLSGVAAISTPVFDALGRMAGALSVIGVMGYLDVSENGQIASKLLSTAARISRNLGYRG
jgi:DNA-binding IclR family transcriptional regulator